MTDLKEMEDPQDVLKEKCGELPKCSKLREELDTCNERVTSKSNTTETCVQELFDFVHCVDHCVSIKVARGSLSHLLILARTISLNLIVCSLLFLHSAVASIIK